MHKTKQCFEFNTPYIVMWTDWSKLLWNWFHTHIGLNWACEMNGNWPFVLSWYGMYTFFFTLALFLPHNRQQTAAAVTIIVNCWFNLFTLTLKWPIWFNKKHKHIQTANYTKYMQFFNLLTISFNLLYQLY